jgi:hypothetical protein
VFGKQKAASSLNGVFKRKIQTGKQNLVGNSHIQRYHLFKSSRMLRLLTFG